MPLSLGDRRPDLVDSLNEAYAEAQSAADQAPQIGSTALGDVLAGDLSSTAVNRSVWLGNVTTISNPETRDTFTDTLELSKRLFGRIKLEVPSEEDFRDAGIDFEKLGAIYEDMKASGLAPQIVLAPHLELDEWRRLGGLLKAESLLSESATVFDGIDFDPENTDTDDHDFIVWEKVNDPELIENVPQIQPVDSMAAPAAFWTLRIIQGTTEGTPVETEAHQVVEVPQNYPTPNEYLTMQTMRRLSGKQLLDEKNITVLNSRFEGGFETEFVLCGYMIDIYPEDTEPFKEAVTLHFYTPDSDAIPEYGTREARC